ncbi:hypothetical protein EV356DRAFT_523554 [Viridothelium virens]|uniref:RING-type E3 ubiquitin transferase n=1 Tax=Viridothelium virens TaxID=1048519 RepID=A0A6A6H9M3_VIRVR|nr:hypothetical protein EV356DRAFT_523554 [Viridothelium virens]
MPSSSAAPCIICLDAVTERAVAVPCNHLNFDFLCLVSWLQERSKCPLCNAHVEEVQYDWRSPDDYKTYRIDAISEARPNPLPTSSSITARVQRQRRPPRPRRLPPIQWGRPANVDEDAPLRQRRRIYQNQMYSLHVGSNRVSRFRDFTPQTFAASEELQSRARMFARRELQVFEFLNTDANQSRDQGAGRRARNAEFLLEYIVAILKTIDIKGSEGQAEEMLQEFLGRDSARLFLHELGAWLRSPYMTLEHWDRAVQYPK